MLTPKPNNVSTNRIPLVLRLDKTLPNIKEIVNKHWHLLQINPNHKNIVEEKPIIDYRRIRNLRELIGSNRTLNDRVVRKNNIEKKQLYCSSWDTRKDGLCCQQVIKTNYFISYQTGQMFKIFYKLNCKRCGFIYLLQCQIWHFQYVGKSETAFNSRLNSHRKEIKAKTLILVCKQFQTSNYNFQRDAKFTLIQKKKKKEKEKKEICYNRTVNEKTFECSLYPVLIKNLMMSKKISSVSVIFNSEYCTNTYLNNSWNRINTEAAQHAIMVIYDVKYDNIQKDNSENFTIL